MGSIRRTAQAMYHEAFAVLMQACENRGAEFRRPVLSFQGLLGSRKATAASSSAALVRRTERRCGPWAVARGINVISLGPASRARDIASRYRDDWAAAGRMSGDLPMIGISRHIVVAETDGEARRIADEAYRPWREALEFLFQRSHVAFPLAESYPQRFDELAAIGHGIAGSPTTVLNFLKELTRETGVNYVCVPHDLRHHALRGGRYIGAAARPGSHADVATRLLTKSNHGWL